MLLKKVVTIFAVKLTLKNKIMKKQFLLYLLISQFAISLNAQITASYFDHVPYIGAFDETNDWTNGWANFDPQNAVYGTATVTVQDSIWQNTTWNAGTVYKLMGMVYVTAGTTLTIPAGTVIRGGDGTASLIIEPGAKIIAEGTATNPIVFTSNNPVGDRQAGDWGGIVICGKAINNLPGGTGVIEGGLRTSHGGNVANDDSGILKYVRVEFAGYAFQPNKEINGLTLGSVGSATTIDYVQISFSNDDSFEWFGGSVNCKHLISFRTLDDDFDTDNGFSGNVQFGIIVRDPDIADVSGSNAFESDNDATGSTNTPQTSATFSNISVFGPLATLSDQINSNYKRAMHIRRNSSISIYNSYFMGYPTGLCIDGSLSEANATNNSLKIEYSLIVGSKAGKYFSIGATGTTVGDSLLRLAAIRDYFFATTRQNDTLATNDLLKITSPFAYTTPDFKPMAESPVLNRSIWYDPNTRIENSEILNNAVIFPNPFNKEFQVSINLEQKSNVKVSIFDVTGKKIATIFDGTISGLENISYSNSNLNAGIYFVQILTNESSKTIKLISE